MWNLRTNPTHQLIPEGEHLADLGMERQKLLKEKKELEAKLAEVLWEDGHEPSEDDPIGIPKLDDGM